MSDFDNLNVRSLGSSGGTILNSRVLGQVTLVTTTPNGGSPQTIASGITYLPAARHELGEAQCVPRTG